MSTPIMMVTLIWQFTNIWNDFLFGVAFSGADSKPITVGLNNMANTTSSVKKLQRGHGRRHHRRPAHHAGLRAGRSSISSQVSQPVR